jgi:hypothetical protein
MPNWVYNGLTIEGNPDSVNKLVIQLNEPFKRVHDSWNILTSTQEKKLTLYTNPIFSFWNIIKPTNLKAYENQPDYKSNQSMEDMMKHDGDDWYNWNVRNWGVKWDVAVSSDDEYPETSIEGPVQNGENLVVHYNFNTPWGLAMPALTNLSSQYPELLFTLSYEEETGWGGELEILRGKTISDESYGWKCRECDSTKDEAVYCEECENEVCSFCGYGTSEEGCAEHEVEANA